ncbi:MAG: flavin reductase [Oscillospiraceae bacterium]|jgi:flavin reductase (DIM6/NTAB) family NADH-FMN oxidoreductase RutF|nr:flavin reductase [Oscillospiraceae bacterium]
MSFSEIKYDEISGNIFDRVGRQWMLITGGGEARFNTMTASWGGAGILWGKPVAFCFIRPQRYTYEFVENGEFFTLSFYGEEHRAALLLCGSKSGRDLDKAREAGLTPRVSDAGAVYFGEAELALVCRKIYSDDLKPERFLSPDIAAVYPGRDYHRMYIGEILQVLKKD